MDENSLEKREEKDIDREEKDIDREQKDGQNTEEKDLEGQDTEGQDPEGQNPEGQDPEGQDPEGKDIEEKEIKENAAEKINFRDKKHAPQVPAKSLKENLNIQSFLLGAGTALLIVALAAVLFFSLPIVFPAVKPDSLGSIKKVNQIQAIIRAHYLNDPDEQKQTDYMMLGIVAGLDDKYAAYYTEEQYQEILQSHKGQMKGVGITISEDAESGEIVVEAVQNDSPADKAGVEKGDILLEVNGTEVTGKTPSDTALLISKSETDDITLKVRRDGKERNLDMKKETLNLTSASGKMLEDSIGYIQITAFNNATPDQFQKAYEKLQKQGMKALVLDLRDNGGGLVDPCVKIASSILPKGPIVYEQDRQGHEKHRDNKKNHKIEVPMTVLVNENTASASEILSGAIRDYDAGILVGTTTYGKGIEQDTYKLYDGSRLKITTTHYFTPNHFDLNGKGLEPDIKVEEGDSDDDADKDAVLDRAVKYLKEQL